jgi:hypothetical protein
MSLPFDSSSLVCLEAVADPRVNRNNRHKLDDILVMALCGFLAGCECWVDDQSRIRQGHAAENAGLLRRLALSILKQDTRYSNSLRCKRLRAAWETSAMEHFLAIFTGN